MSEFVKALLFVVVAEMGDKTQLLAMAMAGKYKVAQVMLGVLVATILNHALAVGLGSYINSLIPMATVKIVAGAAFLIFGFWTLRGDKIDEDEKKKQKFGPVVTVGIAFFLAEMGDKTQLMTIAIAANGHFPLLILLGTTTGMLIADGIGIVGGAWMCKHIPEKYIKWGAGLVFLFFGTLTLYNSVPDSVLKPLNFVAYLVVMGILIYLFGVRFSYKEQVCKTCEEEKEKGINMKESKVCPK